MRRSAHLVLAMAIFGLVGIQALGTTSGFEGLGHLDGGAMSRAEGVSGDGSVAVGYGDSSRADPEEGFRWAGGVMSGLGDMGG